MARQPKGKKEDCIFFAKNYSKFAKYNMKAAGTSNKTIAYLRNIFANKFFCRSNSLRLGQFHAICIDFCSAYMHIILFLQRYNIKIMVNTLYNKVFSFIHLFIYHNIWYLGKNNLAI